MRVVAWEVPVKMPLDDKTNDLEGAIKHIDEAVAKLQDSEFNRFTHGGAAIITVSWDILKDIVHK